MAEHEQPRQPTPAQVIGPDLYPPFILHSGDDADDDNTPDDDDETESEQQ